MQPLLDAIVDLVVEDIVRELETKNAACAAGKQDARGVKDEPGNDTPNPAGTENVLALQ